MPNPSEHCSRLARLSVSPLHVRLFFGDRAVVDGRCLDLRVAWRIRSESRRPHRSRYFCGECFWRYPTSDTVYSSYRMLLTERLLDGTERLGPVEW